MPRSYLERWATRSKFLEVRCPYCQNIQVIFSHASTQVRCLACNAILARPSGGKAQLSAQLIRELG